MHKQRGFTLIEFLIVLVIAGLFILVVFLAVPAVQRTAHNNSRHKDATLVLAAVVDYKSQSSNGALPDGCDTVDASCFLKDVKLAHYRENAADAAVSFVKLAQAYEDGDSLLYIEDEDVTEKMVMYSFAICNSTGTAPTGEFASPQSVVVLYAIETFTGPAMQCKQV